MIQDTDIPGIAPEKPLPRAATRNACKLCSPLGAVMVFKGIRGCLPFLHGSQGCATYIRRYLISHYREPVDIASSSFSEDDAIFGGARNFAIGIENVIRQYEPEWIGVATTCLSETIGDHMTGMIKTYREQHADGGPPLVHVSTPAYTGTHSDGYLDALLAIVAQRVKPAPDGPQSFLNLIPPMATCADLRYLKELASSYGVAATLLPDYSETLEGESWDTYHRISPGGTAPNAIACMSSARGTLEIGHQAASRKESAGKWLESHYGVPLTSVGWPIGIRQSDQLMAAFSELSGRPMPAAVASERGRLVDAYVDGHKYIAGKKVALFGEPDLVIAMAAFVSEIGMRPVLCATGSRMRDWERLLAAEGIGNGEPITALHGTDHAAISEHVERLAPDLLVGSSKGFPLAKCLDIPLMRLGFPIHDRFGAQRQLTMGYRGTLSLFDEIVNLMMARKQTASDVGYSYL